jgi:hypothetical protein
MGALKKYRKILVPDIGYKGLVLNWIGWIFYRR